MVSIAHFKGPNRNLTGVWESHAMDVFCQDPLWINVGSVLRNLATQVSNFLSFVDLLARPRAKGRISE